MMATCRICEDPLVVEIEPDSDDEGQASSSQPMTVPDDLTLHTCGCQFHWQCLIDESVEIASSLACPACSKALGTSSSSSSSSSSSFPVPVLPAITCRYLNEGGLQDPLDLAPSIREEAYLSSHPEARPARALHLLASEGDAAGVIELLRNVDTESAGAHGDGEVAVSAGQLLRWNDPLSGGKTALHVAVENGREDVFLLLLWLGSAAPTERFPEQVRGVAEALGLPRREVVGREEDVRFLRDGNGRVVGEVLEGMGAPWKGFVEAGLLA